ncbi:glutathione S-transferase N-terminal domain-containing protein [Comamonas flocculans]|uniref:Glutathione S-transferase n=1 Tax=Comamonas flocculans TaxID=2597701 RepID=A0A5B8RVF3_9BURK|nr:glutathione S-transferase N-terminal domain-containing protein [Comamonas flocculans]QEA12732.1 glutathione S-transferase [Comamonas flocculans]
MKLIGTLTSPYVRKVRVVLAEKKLDCQFELDDVWSGDTHIAHSNPLGKVPCLVLDGGDAMFDSRVIVEYLDTLSPVGRLIPAPGRERAEVKTWEALADGVLDAGVLAWLEANWPGRSPGERSNAWRERQLGKVRSSLQALDQGLGDKAFCVGIHLSLADIAVGCALGWLAFRLPELDWRTEHANLARLHDKLAERASFAETRPRLA